MDHKEDFCEHFCEMTDKEIAADVRKSINSFLKKRADGEDFGAKMVKKAIDRINRNHEKAVNNGSNGGRPTKDKGTDAVNGNATDDKSGTSAPSIDGLPTDPRELHSLVAQSMGIPNDQLRTGGNAPLSNRPPVRESGLPRSMDDVRAFANAENLDYDDCREWWEINFVERHGADKDGKRIKNWKGALVNWCKAQSERRKSA